MVEDRARDNEAKSKASLARTDAPLNKRRPGRFYPLRGRGRCGWRGVANLGARGGMQFGDGLGIRSPEV
jgi:hypothetical protein